MRFYYISLFSLILLAAIYIVGTGLLLWFGAWLRKRMNKAWIVMAPLFALIYIPRTLRIDPEHAPCPLIAEASISRSFLWAIAILFVIGNLSGCQREKSRLDQEVRRLCAIDGGVQVLETVLLEGEEYRRLLDKDGELKIPIKGAERKSDPYFVESETRYFVKGNPEMWRSEYRLIRRGDGKILAKTVFYARRGGDWPGPWHESSFSCPETDATRDMSKLALRITEEG